MGARARAYCHQTHLHSFQVHILFFFGIDQAVYDETDFWQTNFVAATGTYEIVYNIEVGVTCDRGGGTSLSYIGSI